MRKVQPMNGRASGPVTHPRPAASLAALCVAAATIGALGCGGSSASPIGYDSAKVVEIRDSLGDGASAEAGPAVQLGTGWAAFRGRVVLDGAAPARAPLNITKDVEVCTQNPDATKSQALRVGENGAVRDFLVFARSVHRVHESASTPPSEPFVFDQKYCEFLSHVAGVMVGQSVVLKNSDSVAHNTKIDGRRNTANVQIPAGAELSWEAKAEEPAPMNVSCSIHPWMIAKLIPRENGYFAVTGPDGTFEIANLPAGEDVELQFWHEAVGSFGAVTIEGAPDGANLKSNGRLTAQFPEDGEVDVTITLPASSVSVPGA